MVALGIFCTNAINILAGINGLEVRCVEPGRAASAWLLP